MENANSSRTVLNYRFVILYLLLGVIVAIGAIVMQERWQQDGRETVFMNDGIQFWCAGRLIAEGRSPYDVEGQAALSAAVGWDREGFGEGLYDFMPFYYPYWAAIPMTVLATLSFTYFIAAWSVLQYVAAILAAFLASRTCERGNRLLVFLAIFLFPLTLQVAEMGQVANLMLLGLVSLWCLCERKSDLAAGAILALLSTKPQISIILIPLVLLWAWRQQRHRIFVGFGTTLAGLLAISFAMHPTWLFEFLAAPQVTPMVTETRPDLVTTWAAVPRVLGCHSLWLLVFTVPVAGVAAYWAVTNKAQKDESVANLISVALLSVWFISPYGRSYDYVVLLFPLMLLINRTHGAVKLSFLALFALLPHAYQLIRWQRETYTTMGLEVVWSWFPVLLAAAWIAQQNGWLEKWNRPIEVPPPQELAATN